MHVMRYVLPALLITALYGQPSPVRAADANVDSLRKQAEAGDATAEVAWGRHLLDSKDQATRASSTEWFRKAAELGNHDGEWMLGSAYMGGQGVPNDVATGLDWMHKSLVDGTPDHMATYGLTRLVVGGFNGGKNDGMEWLDRSVDAGSTKGLVGKGMLQLSGALGIKKDPAAGGQLIRKAADKGSAEAQAVLGNLYLSDMLGAPDVPQAMKWLAAAATQGRGDAQATLGYFLISGDRGVPKQPDQGVVWAEKAVAQNEAAGYYALGTAYLFGSGKPRDPAQAWYNLAVAARLDTKHQLTKVADRMSDAATDLKPGELEALREKVAKIPLPATGQGQMQG